MKKPTSTLWIYLTIFVCTVVICLTYSQVNRYEFANRSSPIVIDKYNSTATIIKGK